MKMVKRIGAKQEENIGYGGTFGPPSSLKSNTAYLEGSKLCSKFPKFILHIPNATGLGLRSSLL